MNKLILAAAILFGTTAAHAQADKTQEIIIQKKGDKDARLNIEFKGDEVLLNGQPAKNYSDSNISIVQNTTSIPETAVVTKTVTEPATRGFLGVITVEDAKGAKISSVSPGSPAAIAGLKKDDIITAINKTKITSPESLKNTVSQKRPDEVVDISYIRGNKQEKTKATLDKQQTAGGRLFENDNPFADLDLSRLFEGFRLPGDRMDAQQNKTGLGLQIQERRDKKGVTVINVTPGSAAEAAGLKVKDIITRMNGEAIKDMEDIKLATEFSEQADKPMDLEVLRDGKTVKLKIQKKDELKTMEL